MYTERPDKIFVSPNVATLRQVKLKTWKSKISHNIEFTWKYSSSPIIDVKLLSSVFFFFCNFFLLLLYSNFFSNPLFLSLFLHFYFLILFISCTSKTFFFCLFLLQYYTCFSTRSWWCSPLSEKVNLRLERWREHKFNKGRDTNQPHLNTPIEWTDRKSVV